MYLRVTEKEAQPSYSGICVKRKHPDTDWKETTWWSSHTGLDMLVAAEMSVHHFGSH